MDDDIEAILKAAEHMGYQEERRKPFLNPISNLPHSKKKLKLAIKERIRFLYAAYISLASFAPDESVDLFWEEGHEREKQRILKGVLREMEKSRKELEKFYPLNGSSG